MPFALLQLVEARRNFERPFRIAASHPRVPDKLDYVN